ncbi:TonB-dependent receptor [Chitinophaga horti]|uniref:TonB-dependent receptor n=1 Tax=Chitinophaga horti TaxID=2920382 RepID=A0ABY6J603_9BACT|nr:TonB-dependent receptor [Chitinophaga horti]UYQ95106.1 TonB-dependent receptor [Chitinophaga horti]
MFIFPVAHISRSFLLIAAMVALTVPAMAQQSGRADTTGTPVGLKAVTVAGNAYQKQDDVIDIKKIAQPVTVITKQTIALMGSRRLDEVMREQTGMSLVSDLGSGNRSVGLQMQGFGSEYIMILINGQPMAGRFNGNFDLSRISVSDIERIEIIKGASSSLYGCEALGGVVNIITRQVVTQAQGSASLQYGSFNSVDAILEGETPFANHKGSAYLSGNFYKTDGFNVNTQYLKQGQTGPPYNSLNLQGRLNYKLNDVHTLQLSGRYAGRNSLMQRSYGTQQFDDQLDEKDLNAGLSLNSKLNSGTRLLTRYYLTRNATDQEVTFQQTGTALQTNRFVQSIHRLELQASHDFIGTGVSLTGGAGGDYQLMTNRAEGGQHDMYNYFGYVQANYKKGSKYDLILGARYDGNNVYGGKLNGTFGAGYQPAKWVKLKLSVGQGFKSPTYAQLYQVFTNVMQGYTVIGANVFAEKAEEMRKAGMIQSLWPLAAQVGELQPETSTSFNLGVTFMPVKALEVNVNGFYNNIKNQLFNQQVGIMSNSQQLYTFFNVERAYTTGLESVAKWMPLTGLSFSAGYQYLIAKDRGVEDSIKAGAGKYATVRADGGVRNASVSDYYNLPNRSRHSANFQVFYEYQPWGLGVSLRGNYRGKYGFMDMDNNGFIDPYDVYVEGYFMGYVSVQKKLFNKRMTLQLSVDNVFDYTDYLMPAQPGRMVMGGVSWQFSKKTDKLYF